MSAHHKLVERTESNPRHRSGAAVQAARTDAAKDQAEEAETSDALAKVEQRLKARQGVIYSHGMIAVDVDNLFQSTDETKRLIDEYQRLFGEHGGR